MGLYIIYVIGCGFPSLRSNTKDHKNGTNCHPVWHTDIMLVLGFDYVVKMMLCRWFYVMGDCCIFGARAVQCSPVW